MARRAFTLIEILIFLALFSIAIIGLITIFITVLRIQSRQTSAFDVETQGQFLLQQLQYYVQTARLVEMTQDVATGTLTLGENISAFDPTTIGAASGTLYIAQGAGTSPQALTSKDVNISNLSFTRHYNQNGSSSAYGVDSVSFSFLLAASTTNQTMMYSQTFQSSATVLAPVGKIALLQKSVSSASGVGIASVSSTFPAANTAGDLLVAVVANTTSSATVTLSDAAGNTWTKIANPTYPAYNEEISVFDVANALATSSEKITAAFGATVANASLYIYEYRGASAASSFDASSSLITTSTASISSGFASPTSTVELLFGVTYANPSTGVMAAGPGFTMESSSSVSGTYVEDQDMYVTGPVAATWTYSGGSPPTTSSSAMVATFK